MYILANNVNKALKLFVWEISKHIEKRIGKRSPAVPSDSFSGSPHTVRRSVSPARRPTHLPACAHAGASPRCHFSWV